MATSLAPTPRREERRPLLGLRQTPGRLTLAVFRLPLVLYRRGKGWMLGRTFMLFVHVGRKTRRPHDAVAMVLADDPHTGEVVICSGWGPEADWVLNLHAGPANLVSIGRDRFVPEHRFRSEDEAVAVGVAFRDRHPWRMKLVSTILGWGDLRSDTVLREFVRGHPFVAFRPMADGDR